MRQVVLLTAIAVIASAQEGQDNANPLPTPNTSTEIPPPAQNGNANSPQPSATSTTTNPTPSSTLNSRCQVNCKEVNVESLYICRLEIDQQDQRCISLGDQCLLNITQQSNLTNNVMDQRHGSLINFTGAPFTCSKMTPAPTPLPSDPIVSATKPPATTAESSSSNNAAVFGVIGGLLAVALVTFFVIIHKRRQRQNKTSKDVVEVVVNNTDHEGYQLTASPRANVKEDVNFFKYVASVKVFKSQWLALNGVRTSSVKGSCHLLQGTLNGTKHVLKGIDFSKVSEANLFTFSRAVERLITIPSHENVTKVTGVALLEVAQQFAVTTEFMNKGSLGGLLVEDAKKPSLTLAQKLQICVNVASGLGHIHASKRLYGQLHPEKVLVNVVDGTMLCKLNVLALLDQDFVEIPQCSARIGTMIVPYTAPEQRQGGAISIAGDIYSLGVVMAQIFTCQLPFHEKYHELGYVRGDNYILATPSAHPYELSNDIPAPIISIMKSCWSSDPSSRPALTTIVATLNSIHIESP